MALNVPKFDPLVKLTMRGFWKAILTPSPSRTPLARGRPRRRQRAWPDVVMRPFSAKHLTNRRLATVQNLSKPSKKGLKMVILGLWRGSILGSGGQFRPISTPFDPPPTPFRPHFEGFDPLSTSFWPPLGVREGEPFKEGEGSNINANFYYPNLG